MSTSDHRARSARRPVAVLIALFVGLGVVGAAGGAALGTVGAASASPSAPFGDGHHRHGPDLSPRAPR